MPLIFNLKGYTHPDPLDSAPVFMQYILMMLVTCVASVLLVYAITDVFHLLEFKTFGINIIRVRKSELDLRNSTINGAAN